MSNENRRRNLPALLARFHAYQRRLIRLQSANAPRSPQATHQHFPPATGQPCSGSPVTETQHDAVGNRTAQIDARSTRVEFVYDGMARLTATVNDADTALQGTLREEYDALNKTATVDAAGRRTEYHYDTRNRLTETRRIGRAIDDTDHA